MRLVGEIADYTVEQGWTEGLAAELVDASLESEIRQRTPNDSLLRFRDIDAAKGWYSSSEAAPIVYSLRHSANQDLGGVAWFSHKPHSSLPPQYQATFAVRLYVSARGKSLAYPFSVAVHEDVAGLLKGSINGIWLETDSNNEPALRLYRKLGYSALIESDKRIFMGYEVKSD